MFTLEFTTDGAAFDEGYKTEEIARILKGAANRIKIGADDSSGSLVDSWGNVVGKWKIS